MININPVRFSSINNIFAQPQKVKQFGLASDVFVRSAAPAFKANNPDNESFVDWAARTDYINRDFHQTLFSQNGLIGSGFSHTAYKIPENDKYILRGPNDEMVKMFASDIDYSKTTITDIEDKDLKINIGQPVALITAKTHLGIPMFFEVLKKQEGTSIGVPPYSAISNEYGELKPNVLPYEADERKVKYAQSLEKVANMPVEAYETLISEVKEAAEAGYKLDYLNSNNILIDSNKQRFNLIDMERTPNEANYGNLLYALTNYCYYSTYQAANPAKFNKEKATDNTIKIIQKFVIAMQKQGVKFDKNAMSYEFDGFMRSKPMMLLNESMEHDSKWSYFEKNQVV